MSRSSIDPLILANLESDSATPIYFLEVLVDVASSPETVVRFHNGLGTITTATSDDATSRGWTGAGSLISFPSIQETNRGKPSPFKALLSGVDSSVTNLIFNENYYRAPTKFYISALANGALVANPGLLFSGFAQKIDMTLGGEDQVDFTAESEFMLFKRSRNVRFTDRQLQSEYAGDLGFEFLQQVATSQVVWRGKQNRMGANPTPSVVRAIGRGITSAF